MLVPLLISIGLSMDSFAASLACGQAGKKRRFSSAAKIATSFAAFQGGMAVVGYVLGASFLSIISSFDHWAVFLTLSYLGLSMIADSKKGKRCPVKNNLSMKKIAVLSFATSLDALAVGIGFALLRLDVPLTVLLLTAVTFAFSFIGVYFGGRLREAMSGKAEVFGGLVLLAIGVKILIEHLSA
jgi:manganese efflux pump family protein